MLLLQQANMTQSQFEAQSGYGRAALSSFFTGKTERPRIDLLEALLRVFPTLNLNWLITGQGEMWAGEPPPPHTKEKGKAGKKSAAAVDNPDLYTRLLVQKLEEVARDLRENDPAAYKRLRLGELTGGKENGD